MRGWSLPCMVAALLVVAWVRAIPLSLEGAERGAEGAVRGEIARELSGESPASSTEVSTWIAGHRAEFDRRLELEKRRRRADVSFEAPNGMTFPYLGGYDSYIWLRAARNFLRDGSGCDSIVDGVCRDDMTMAPLGIRSRYATSFHVAAIAAMHRLLGGVLSGFPLSASAFFLSYLGGMLVVFPAFWLGRRFGGTIGGLVCAVTVALNGTVLLRTLGADNDVWNVLLPLLEVWAVVAAIYTESPLQLLLLIGLAAAATALHAAIWSGWIFTSVILVLGLAANAFLAIARRLLHGADGDSTRAMQWAVLLLVGYVTATSLATAASGGDVSPLTAALKVVQGVVGHGGRSDRVGGAGTTASPWENRGPDLPWPSLFDTVQELRDPSLAGIAHSMSGPVFFFVAWLGMILLMLPRRDWQSWHFGLLIAGNLMYRLLLERRDLDPYVLALLLLVPLLIGLGAYLADGSRPVEDQGAGLTIILWFLAALVMAHRGNRFLLLLAPPMGVLCAVAYGRLYDWFARQAWARPRPLRAAAFTALVATLWLPVRQGRAVASGYLPLVNDGWVALLEDLRTDSEPETIVNSWWDYGYFIKFFADRRVLSDGGTLRTHVHHWFARALMSPDERESLGILRMLNCGSAAFPEPEGQLGAYGRLIAHGVSREMAYATITAIAPMSSPDAAAHLMGIGLSPEQVADVLRRSHCDPPPAYLLLPSNLMFSVGWRSIGRESLVESVAVRLVGERGPEPAAMELGERFGLDEAAATEIVRDARSHGGAPPSYAVFRWVPCVGEQEWRCEVTSRLPDGEVLRGVRLRPGDPASARLLLRGPAGDDSEVSPASVLVADTVELREAVAPQASAGGVALLVDPSGRRALLGSDRILRSTFTSLMFLDGRYTSWAREYERRRDRGGELLVWQIDW